MSARVLCEAKYNRLTAWRKKADHHFDLDQEEGSKEDYHLGGKLPNTAN